MKKKFKCHKCEKVNIYDSKNRFSGSQHGGFNVLSEGFNLGKISSSLEVPKPKKKAINCKYCNAKNMVPVNE